MNAVLVLAAAAMGIEVGWQPLPTGGHEYTIQIEPELLHVLEGGGQELASEVPPGIHIRRYRVTVGTGKLAREAGEGAPPVEPPPEPAPTPAADPADPQAPAEAPPPTAEETPAEDAAEGTFAPAGDGAARDAPPEKLPPQRDAGPIQPANYDAAPPSGDSPSRGEETLNKPMLTGGEASRPWPVLVGSVVLLCVSLGANIYLGWIAMQARQKYRAAVARFGAAGAS